jgi:K(+)-stimulated pyrophosphate-energized sodium pump
MDHAVDATKELLDVPVNAWMASCLGVGVFAIIVAIVIHARLAGKDRNTDPIQNAGRAIHLGARGFLRTHLAALAAAALVGALVLLFAFNRAGDAWTVVLAFLVGCLGSGLAGLLATRAAAAGGVRAAQAASKKGLGAALRTAYAPGAAAAFFTAGFAVASVAGLYLGTSDPRRFLAFALGASVTALLARVGGGIFAKASDVAVSLAIRADQDIPDDDLSNPGVVADDVGDLAGDVTGMGADLYESFACAVLAAMTLGTGVWAAVEKAGKADPRDAVESLLAAGPATFVLYPVALFAAGIVAALVAALFVKTDSERRIGTVLHRSVTVGGVLLMAGAAALTKTLGLAEPRITQVLTGAGRDADDPWRYTGPAGALCAVLAGLALGIALGRVAEWSTSENRPPARRLAEESAAGPPTNVLAGLALGMASCAWPAVMIAVTAGVAYYTAGAYGVALAAVGLLAMFAVSFAVHAFGAVAENACGIAEIVRMGPDARRRAEAIDAAAATTAVNGKAFATGAAALTAFALLAVLRQTWDRLHPTQTLRLDLGDVQVQLGLVLGAMVPFLFSSLCIRAVNRVAAALGGQIVERFRESRPGGDGPAPDHAKFVAGGARRAIRRLWPAALLAIGAPVVCGFSPLGVRGLAAMLVGATLSATMLAFTLVHAGAAWDNAKRYVASGVFGGKGSPAYRAAVTGDVVGDPMKDAAGPGLHTLVKLMIVLAIVLLPFFPG